MKSPLTSIIQSFTNDSWFNRIPIEVFSYVGIPTNGRIVKTLYSQKKYTDRFFTRPAKPNEIENSGLGEIALGAWMIHSQFRIDISDGVSITVPDLTNTTGIAKITGVRMSAEVLIEGKRYVVNSYEPWKAWSHKVYICTQIKTEEVSLNATSSTDLE